MGEVAKGTNTFTIVEVSNYAPGARAGLRPGDVISAVNGKKFETTTFESKDGGKGPLEALGWAIDKAEGKDGVLKLTVQSNGESVGKTVNVKLKVIGSFSATYPYRCKKSLLLMEQCSKYIDRKAKAGARPATAALMGLALLARGSREYAGAIVKIRDDFVHKTLSGGFDKSYNWSAYLAGIFLCEYYLMQKDPQVLKAIRWLVRLAETRIMGTGSFGYGLLKKVDQRARPCNSAGSFVLWFWAMARECGVKVDEDKFHLAVTYFTLCTVRQNGGVAYNLSSAGPNAHITSNTLIAFSLIGKEGLRKIGMGKKDLTYINPKYNMGDKIADARKYLLTKNLVELQSGFLVRKMKSARENHAVMSFGMLAAPSALVLYGDKKRFRVWMDYWKWFIRLGIGPNGEVYYHGNNGSMMGDRQLGQDKIGAVTYLMMLAVSQNRLYIHGGYPEIDGIESAELSSAMKGFYRSIRDQQYKRVLGSLARLAKRKPSKETEQAKAMLDYVMTIAKKDLQEVVVVFEEGDLVLATSLFKASVTRFTVTEAHREFNKKLLAETSKKENLEKIRRGKGYYALVKLHEKDPRRAQKYLRAFVQQNVDGYYSRKPFLKEIRDSVLAKQQPRPGLRE